MRLTLNGCILIHGLHDSADTCNPSQNVENGRTRTGSGHQQDGSGELEGDPGRALMTN